MKILKRTPASFPSGTFSIVACCQRTGQLGVISSTAAFAGGAFVPHAKAGIGAVATQALTNVYLATTVLDLLGKDVKPEVGITKALRSDRGKEHRQLAVVNSKGESAAFTGSMNDPWAGHLCGEGYAIAGNILTGSDVLHSMEETFQRSAGSSLGERLILSLESGQAAGGDRRGRQSAVLYIVLTEDYGYVDLRVDDHPEPIVELRRLWEVYQDQLQPVIDLFPRKSRPEGELDKEVWERAFSCQED